EEEPIGGADAAALRPPLTPPTPEGEVTHVSTATRLEDLFAEHAARLRRLGDMLLRDRQESQEVVQEVFIKAHHVHGTTGEPLDWARWLTRVTVNACGDRRRAGWWPRFRRHSESVDALALRAHEPTPEDVVVGAETARQIRDEFARLPRRQRDVFVLRYVAG